MDLLDRIYIVNLDRRTDRWSEVTSMLNRYGIDMSRVERISAVPHPIGSVGCALSHVTIMCRAQAAKYRTILVLEDDADLMQPLDRIGNAIRVATAQPHFKLLTFCRSPYEHASVPDPKLGSDVEHVILAKTTAAYVISESYMDRCAQLMALGAVKLMQTRNDAQYACDVVWQVDMGLDSGFYCTSTSYVRQRPSYSDILNMTVHYQHNV